MFYTRTSEESLGTVEELEWNNEHSIKHAVSGNHQQMQLLYNFLLNTLLTQVKEGSLQY